MLNHIIYHKELIDSWAWFKMSSLQQIGNLWSEVWRTLNYMKTWDSTKFEESELRMFELFDMIMWDAKWKKTWTLREVCRLKEVVTDFIYWNNEYSSDYDFFNKYFFTISVAANEERKKLRLLKNK